MPSTLSRIMLYAGEQEFNKPLYGIVLPALGFDRRREEESWDEYTSDISQTVLQVVWGDHPEGEFHQKGVRAITFLAQGREDVDDFGKLLSELFKDSENYKPEHNGRGRYSVIAMFPGGLLISLEAH